MMSLLDGIRSPADLRQLARSQLPALADALRERLLTSVAGTGGHLSSNLGTVELTIALHYVYDTPADRLVWDVGHQTYAHKMLTGRADRMSTLRKRGGLSGFPRRAESPYDAFGTAHSSTSISAALGMAHAARQSGDQRRCVAIIGDGALTAGMAYEALNNAGASDLDLLVILNDNDMSISPPVGALNQYLGQLMAGRFYAETREAGKRLLRHAPPPLFALARQLEQSTRSLVQSDTLFEKLGFTYTGPIDGHDLPTLVDALQRLRGAHGPQFLHVVTRKGKGYARAEADPIAYHGPGRFDPQQGLPPPDPAAAPSYSQVFGDWLCDMAERDPRLVGITPAMREGSGMVAFSERFPGRYVDAGIAEQHAVTYAAGLACEGLRPVVAIYSTFLQRAYDQLVHDVALQKLPVVFALDRAGMVGPDGPTHAGLFDIAYTRCIPHMSIACPADALECRGLLSTAFTLDHPVTVRYPRGTAHGPVPGRDTAAPRNLEPLPWGRAQVRRAGRGLALLAFGPLLHEALKAAESLNATVVNMRWAKPLDIELLHELARTHAAWVTVEDGSRMGGAGSAVMEALHALGERPDILQLGFEDTFTEHGERGEMLAAEGLDAAGILGRIRARWPGAGAAHESAGSHLRRVS